MRLYEMQHTDNPLRPVTEEVAPTIQARMGTGGNNVPLVFDTVNKLFRKLTPNECERLQCLPDGWTEGIADSHRYKAIGNGMTQTIADWVIGRIVENEERKCN